MEEQIHRKTLHSPPPQRSDQSRTRWANPTPSAPSLTESTTSSARTRSRSAPKPRTGDERLPRAISGIPLEEAAVFPEVAAELTKSFDSELNELEIMVGEIESTMCEAEYKLDDVTYALDKKEERLQFLTDTWKGKVLNRLVSLCTGFHWDKNLERQVDEHIILQSEATKDLEEKTRTFTAANREVEQYRKQKALR